jgi:hypothetical protein
MLRWLAALVLLGGCHKLLDLEHLASPGDARGDDADADRDGAVPVSDAGSDAAPTCPAMVAFDEDGDGLDDSCDPCPTAVSNSVDADGDGLPNACDPDLGANGRDRILLAATFGQASDTLAFTLSNATWMAGNNGRVQLVPSGVLKTTVPYRATRIEVRISAITTTADSARVTIANIGTVECRVTASNCSTGAGTCVEISPANGGSVGNGQLISLVSRIEFSSTTSASSCVVTGNGGLTANSGAPFANDPLGISTSAAMSLDVRSVVIYGDGL